MKKIAIVVAALATLAGNPVHAQTANKKNMGAGAQAGNCSYDNFAWGIGLGALVVLGVVVGVAVGGALGSQHTHG